MREAAASQINLDVATLEFVIRKRLEKEAEQVAPHLDKLENVRKLRQFVDLIRSLPFPVNLWETENILYGPLTQSFNGDEVDPAKKELSGELNQLREGLRIVRPAVVHPETEAALRRA